MLSMIGFIDMQVSNTPYLTIDFDKFKETAEHFNEIFDFAYNFYAVKANPDINILKYLEKLGYGFDCASIGEINLVKDIVYPSFISFGNTVKKEEDIRESLKYGIKYFMVDSKEELYKINKIVRDLAIYNVGIFVRLETSGNGSDWVLGSKFGTSLENCVNLLELAYNLALVPLGVSFHVGSQQKDINQYKIALEQVHEINRLFKLKTSRLFYHVDVGGGFPGYHNNVILDKNCYSPSNYISTDLKEYAKVIKENSKNLVVLTEPGRSIVSSCGTLTTKILLKTKRNGITWLYLDVGVFNGLIECIDEGIKYIFKTDKSFDIHSENDLEEVCIAGPTCDSLDILYQNTKYKLPKDLKTDDILHILGTGCYTNTYRTMNFNGFEPYKIYYQNYENHC